MYWGALYQSIAPERARRTSERNAHFALSFADTFAVFSVRVCIFGPNKVRGNCAKAEGERRGGGAQ